MSPTIRIVWLCTAATILSACVPNKPAFVNDPNEPPRYPPGRKPSLEQAERMVLEHLKNTLRDPDSIKQFSIKAPGVRYVSWPNPFGAPDERTAGWLVCVEYNAKNGYGGYVGKQTDGFVIRATEDGATAWIEEYVNWRDASSRC